MGSLLFSSLLFSSLLFSSLLFSSLLFLLKWERTIFIFLHLTSAQDLQFLECFKIEIKARVPSLTLVPCSALTLIKKVLKSSKIVNVFLVLAMIFLPSCTLTGFKIFFGLLFALFKFVIMAGGPMHILVQFRV